MSNQKTPTAELEVAVYGAAVTKVVFLGDLGLEEVEDQVRDLGGRLTQRQGRRRRSWGRKQAAAARDDADGVAVAIARKRALQADLPDLQRRHEQAQARAEELREPKRRAKDDEIRTANTRRRSDQQALVERFRALATELRAIPTDWKALRAKWPAETTKLMAERVALDPRARAQAPSLDEPAAIPSDELASIFATFARLSIGSSRPTGVAWNGNLSTWQQQAPRGAGQQGARCPAGQPSLRGRPRWKVAGCPGAGRRWPTSADRTQAPRR